MASRVNVRVRSNEVVTLYVLDCPSCGVVFGITDEYDDRRRSDGRTFYCPNQHTMSYHETDAMRLRKVEAREIALRDQLDASIRDAEEARSLHQRDRQRIANGVCPCCNRSFENVRRHMSSKHPDYAMPKSERRLRFGCGCGRQFDTYHGLKIHQGRARSKDWSKPGIPVWKSHLTEGVTP